MSKILTFSVAVFLSFFIAAVVVGCSTSKKIMDENTVTGQIQMVGNEPFARLAIINDNDFYMLDCTGAIKDTVYNNQGRMARVYFSGISTNNQQQKVLKVEKIDIVPSGSN